MIKPLELKALKIKSKPFKEEDEDDAEPIAQLLYKKKRRFVEATEKEVLAEELSTTLSTQAQPMEPNKAKSMEVVVMDDFVRGAVEVTGADELLVIGGLAEQAGA